MRITSGQSSMVDNKGAPKLERETIDIPNVYHFLFDYMEDPSGEIIERLILICTRNSPTKVST